jgi:hypothetical protein
MAGGSDHDVICIETTKVCDFCFQEDRIERQFKWHKDWDGDWNSWRDWCERANVTCQILEDFITCTEVDRQKIDCDKCLFRVTVRVEVPVMIWVDGECIKKTIVFLKQAILSAEGARTVCDVTGECTCVLDWDSKCLICVFDFCVVIKAVVTVQVLVPIQGFCVPRRCMGIECPPVLSECCNRADRPRRGKDCGCGD